RPCFLFTSQAEFVWMQGNALQRSVRTRQGWGLSILQCLVRAMMRRRVQPSARSRGDCRGIRGAGDSAQIIRVQAPFEISQLLRNQQSPRRPSVIVFAVLTECVRLLREDLRVLQGLYAAPSKWRLVFSRITKGPRSLPH